MANLVVEAKAHGHAPWDAYRVVVDIEETRALTDETLRDADELYRTLEHRLNKGINDYLKPHKDLMTMKRV